MDSLFDYKILDTIYKGLTCTVHRGSDLLNNDLVILKIVPRMLPGHSVHERYAADELKYEYDILKTLSNTKICLPLKLISNEDCFALATKDIGGFSLNCLYQKPILSEKDFLPLAVNIIDSIANIHKNEILHNRLSLSNIVFNPETCQVDIIDFAGAAPLNKSVNLHDKNFTLATQWAYISPEMTGRTKYNVDVRSDLYSLGVIFYRLICGHFPFEASDAAEYTHAHLALQPLQIKLNTKSCSETLSKIIMKLLEKSPDKRYQTAKGLLQDLKILQEQNPPTVSTLLTVGQKDIGHKLKIPNKLYGRKNQYLTIFNAWERLKHSKQKQVVTVCGHAGTGKTTLIKKIDTPKFRQNALYLYGKFDQTGSRPYQAIIGAFQMMINWILGEKQSVFEKWRKRLNHSLLDNGKLMIDIIPDLEKIIGHQPDVVPLSPEAEKNRFVYVIHQFIKTFITQERPLFLFIDDLQWADPASMKIITSICLSSEIQHLLFIGAFRDNEMERHHPWLKLIGKIHTRHVHQITLLPLSKNQICSLLFRTLKFSSGINNSLAEITLKKTNGNPLFVREFLQSIFQKKYLWFDLNADCWRIDLEAVTALPVNKNVAELILERTDRLDLETCQILFNAACIGNQFNVQILATGCNLDVNKIETILALPLNNGIVLQETGYTPGSNPDSKKYFFAHDSFQKALIQIIPEKKRSKQLWIFAWRLLSNDLRNSPSENLFMITGLLNKASDYTRNPDKLKTLAALNRDCGVKALESAAYEPALDYFRNGIDALEKILLIQKNNTSIWDIDKSLCLSLFQGASQSAFLLSRYKEMDYYILCANDNIKDLVQKTKLYEIKISSLYARNKMDEAIDNALEFSNSLGIRLPNNPGKRHVLFGLLMTKLLLTNHSMAELEELPFMSDKKILSALQVLSCVTLATFYARPNLLPLIIFKTIRLSLKYGITDTVVFGFAGFGFIQCGILNQMDSGFRFGLLAKKLIKTHNMKSIEAKTGSTIYGAIFHWKNHLQKTCIPLLKAHKTGLVTGDHQFSCICAEIMCIAEFIYGKNLNVLADQTRKYLNLMINLKQNVVHVTTSILMQAILNLKTDSLKTWKLKGSAFDIDEQTEELYRSNDYMALFRQYYIALMLCFYFDKSKKAVEFADKAHQFFDTAKGLSDSVSFLFFDSLARIALLHQSGKRKKTGMAQIRANQKRLRKWAESAPENIEQKYHLVQAEIYAFQGQHKKAADSYKLSADKAEKNNYLNDHALANELAGRYFLSIHNKKQATISLSKAHDLYDKWGALAKVIHIEKIYPPFVFDQSKKIKLQLKVKPNIQNIIQTMDKTLIDDHQPELHTILKASQTIAQETELKIILGKLISLIMEHSGASKAALFLYSESVLKLEAFALAGTPKKDILQGIVFDEKDKNMPCSIIQYVLRTDQTVILENAVQSTQFSTDNYVTCHTCKSILCTPIFNKNMKAGILLLENEFLEGAFSKKQLKLLEILLSQAVVTIENSKLYANLNREKKQKNDAVSEIVFHKKVLKNMSAELTMVEEREKKAIADDLHDSVTQSLALSVLNLKKLSTTLDQNGQKQISTIQDHLNQAVTLCVRIDVASIEQKNL